VRADVQAQQHAEDAIPLVGAPQGWLKVKQYDRLYP
jgi:hypothetical protein